MPVSRGRETHGKQSSIHFGHRQAVRACGTVIAFRRLFGRVVSGTMVSATLSGHGWTDVTHIGQACAVPADRCGSRDADRPDAGSQGTCDRRAFCRAPSVQATQSDRGRPALAGWGPADCRRCRIIKIAAAPCARPQRDARANHLHAPCPRRWRGHADPSA